jgi:hypothetical protein
MAAVTASEMDLHTGWHVAVRTAAVSSVLVAALAVALYQFWGVNRVVLVALAAIVGLTLGLRLPAAAPAPPRRRRVEG